MLDGVFRRTGPRLSCLGDESAHGSSRTVPRQHFEHRHRSRQGRPARKVNEAFYSDAGCWYY